MNSAQCGHCHFPCALSEAFSPASFGLRTIAIGSATMKSNAPNIHHPANPCPFLLAMDAGISPMTTAIAMTLTATDSTSHPMPGTTLGHHSCQMYRRVRHLETLAFQHGCHPPLKSEQTSAMRRL